MVELKIESLRNGSLSSLPVRVPGFNIDKTVAATVAEPVWLHFGAGNIFRIFIAGLAQDLLDQGITDKGIIAADTFDGEIIEDIYKPHDNLTVAAGMRPDGNIDISIIASVCEAVNAASGGKEASDRLTAIACSPSLQMISFTLTEKGYALRGIDGNYLPVVTSDIGNGPSSCVHAMSRVCSLLLARFDSCRRPLALVSMDNCSHNGKKLRNSILEIASMWMEKGYVGRDFTTGYPMRIT